MYVTSNYYIYAGANKRYSICIHGVELAQLSKYIIYNQ